MTAMDTWLARAADDERRRASLEEALIGGGFARYAWYRLRWVLLSRGLAMVVHVVELALLAHVFASADFAAALAVQNAAALVAAFWWGNLELHRNRIRDGGDKTFVTTETGRWMGRGAAVAAVVLAVAGGVVGFRAATTGALSVVDAYALVVCGRLGVDLVARAYYSGVYARRRVYRPLPAIVGVELVSLGAVLALWPLIGAWSFPAALAVSVIASRGLLIAYTGLAYDSTRTQRPRVRVRPGLRFRRVRADAHVVVWAGVANASARVGSALVLVLLLQDLGAASALAVVLHLVSPLLATASSWAQVFYLDFRRLEEPLTALLRRRLGARLHRLSLVMGAGLWCVSAAVVLWHVGPAAHWPVVLLLPVFVAASILGQLQLRYFAQGQYGRVAAGALALAGALVAGLGAVAVAGVTPLVGKPLAIAGAMACAALVVAGLHARRTDGPPTGIVSSFLGWLAATRAARGPVCVSSADLSAASHQQAQWLARWLAERLGVAGAVHVDGARRILWFAAADVPGVTAASLVVASGGLVGMVRTVAADDGASALRAARADGLVPPSSPSSDGLGSVARHEFHRQFAGGVVEDLRSTSAQGELRRLTPSTRRALWLDALADARGARGTRRRSGYDVTTVVEGGELCTVFAVPRTVPVAERQAWRQRVRRHNLNRAVTRRAES